MEARAEAGLTERHPCPWLLWLVWGLMALLACAVVVVECQLGHYSPPLFAVSVTGVSGLDVRSSDAAATAPRPTFRVVLRVENQDFGEHCYTEGRAAVGVGGVLLARADNFDGFCVPGRGAVEVLFVATGGGLGIPDGLYDGGVGEAVAVRVRLDGDVHPVESESDLVGTHPVLLRCTVTLDGRPSEPCARFLMLKRGRRVEVSSDATP